jgi:hypothetical protein
MIMQIAHVTRGLAVNLFWALQSHRVSWNPTHTLARTRSHGVVWLS